jgi:hypothetical protein
LAKHELRGGGLIYFLKQNNLYAGDVRLWGKTGGVPSENGLHYRHVRMIFDKLVKGQNQRGGWEIFYYWRKIWQCIRLLN